MSRTIKFSRPGAPGVLEFIETQVPAPAPTEVRIKVKAIGLNRAESMWRHGEYIELANLPARLGYDSGREYRPFLMAIARNVLVDHLRGVSREGRSHRGAIDARVAGGGDHGDSVPWADPHTISLAERYVANLGDPERGVYLERYVRCRSQEHSALELGLSRQQVRAIEGKLHAGLARAISRANLGVSALRGRPAGAWGRPVSGLVPLGLSLASSRESPRVTAEPEPGS